MSLIMQRRTIPALLFGLALLAGLYALLAPLKAQAADGPPMAAADNPAAPQIGEPVITASAVVVEAGAPATLFLVNGPPLQQGYFVSKAPKVEYLCEGKWLPLCPKPLKLDRDGKASLQFRAQENAAHFDAIFNFRMTSGQTLPAGVSVRFYTKGSNPPDPPPSAQPEFMWPEIKSRYPGGGFYLETVNGAGYLHMAIDFKNQSGYAEWQVNGVTVKTTPESQFVSQLDLDMGKLRPANVPKAVNGQYTYSIRAFNPSGASKTMAITFIQVPYDNAWFRDVSWVKPPVLNGAGDWATYDLALRIPTSGFRFNAPGFITSNPNARTDAGMTFQGAFSFPVKCIEGKEIAAKARADAYFTNVYLVEAKGNMALDGKLALGLRNCQLLGAQLTGEFLANGRASGEKQVKVVDLLVDWLLDPGWVNDFIKWITTKFLDPKITVKGEVAVVPGFQANATVTPVSPYLNAGATFAGDAGLSGDLNVTCCASTAELIVNLGTREGKVRFDAKGLDNVDKLLFDATLRYALTVKGRILAIWMRSTSAGECRYPPYGPNQSCRKTAGAGDAEVWAWIPHPSPLGYSTFEPTASLIGGSNPQLLVSDAFTYTTTSLAIDPATGHALALWDHDDLGKVPGQSMEIAYSYWDGTTWSVPATITNDNYQDMAAQVAWTTGGHAVAVWHRLNQVQGPGEPSVEAMTGQAEIATATYDENTNTWSAPTLLTSDQNADMGVQLARSPAGKLLAVWASTPGGWSPDQAAVPTPVYAAFYDGGWGAPMLALDLANPLGNLTAALDTTGAAIAATMQVTPTGASTPVHQAVVTAWNGTVWSPPLAATSDGSDAYALNLVYGQGDQPILIWIAGQTLYLRNLVSEQVASMALDPALGYIDELHVTADAQDNLAAVLRSQADQADLYTAYYDHDRQLWGTPRPLTGDGARERSASLAFDNTGVLHLFYGSTAQDDGPTDLVLARYTFVRNLTVADGGLVIGSDHPEAGATVTISGTVTNSGDLPIDGVTLTLYDGDPQGGGTAIATSVLTTPLAAGAAADLVAPYRPGVDGGIRTIFLVADGANIVAESNENDNRVSRRAFGPDLAITAAEAEFAIGDYLNLAAVIENVGTSSTPTTTLNFRQNTVAASVAAGGSVAATITVPPLAAGEVYTDSAVWEQGQLLAGAYPLVASVNEGDFEELDLLDNVADLTFNSGPDIMISPYAVETGNMLAASVPVTVEVANLGNLGANNVVIGFHNGWALDATSEVISQTLPQVGANESVQLVVNMPGPLACGLNIVAGKQGGTDLDWGNNLVVVAGASSCTFRAYLPIIGR
ncbi:MAG: CARDB domain-containing protein [Caldilineaceae bacterium]